MFRSEFCSYMRSKQVEIRKWLINQIGQPEQFESIENRSQRFLEESIELVQATGLSEAQCHDLVKYVFNRPIGQVPQEIGGTIVCLAVLAERLDYNVGVCLEMEIDRIHRPEMIDKVRAAIERKRNDGVGI